MNTTINVLWIDDLCNDETSRGFIKLAYSQGIKIEAFDTARQGIKALQDNLLKWDAIILDVLDSNSRKGGMFEAIQAIVSLEKKDTYIPWFIFSAQDMVFNDETFDQTLQGHFRPYSTKAKYNKITDTSLLFVDILKTVKENNTTKWLIRNKYQNIFKAIYTLFSNKGEEHTTIETDLLKIVISIDDPQTASDPRNLNELRKFIELIFFKLETIDVIPQELKDCNAKSRHVCTFSNQIPVFIRDAVRRIVRVTQAGSHQSDIDEMVRQNKAPYLVTSLVYELFDIIIWLNEFIEQHPDNRKNKYVFSVSEADRLNREKGKI